MADHTERSPAEQEALYRAFAKLYCDASKPETFEKPVACYRALVDPNPPEWSLKKSPYRYLNHRITKHEIARIKVQNRTVVEELEGLTHSQYVHELLENARLFAARGGIGDSTASAQLYKTIGTAIGALVTKTEDVTKRQPLLTSEAQMDELQEQLNRLRALKAPVVDAEYTIESEETNGGSTEGTQRTLARPDDRGASAPLPSGGESADPDVVAEQAHDLPNVRPEPDNDHDGAPGGSEGP